MSILAIDFGGTRIRAGWYSDELWLRARHETLTRATDDTQAVLDRIVATARAVAAEAERPKAIGIAAPGPLDADAGVIFHAATLPDWHYVALAEIVSDAFGGVPTHMQNDANVAALAEYYFGAARGADPTIYLTISTGIGGGAVINGELFTGYSGLAIEPGHLQFLQPDGSIKRLEELASGTGIGQIASRRLAGSDTPSALRGADPIDGKAVGQAARGGDTFAQTIIEEAGSWLGLGLVNILHMFNPRAIVIGGSVAQLGDLLFEPARQIIASRLLDPAFYHPDLIRAAKLGDNVCLVGAALHARRKTFGRYVDE